MGLLDRFRTGHSDESAGGAEDVQEGSASDLAIEDYDRLEPRAVSDKLSGLSQVELGEVEDYERAHKERPAILNKLRFMRSNEPFEGYDAMEPAEIKERLAKSDSQGVKAVRDYERKFQGRREILEETARVLPQASESASETQSREEKTARVRASMRKRN